MIFVLVAMVVVLGQNLVLVVLVELVLAVDELSS
jgi:hypothetical protein